jgi:hypothetical protein
MWFVGDVHGSFKRYLWMTQMMMHKGGRKKGFDCSLQVGDMGLFSENELAKLTPLPRNKFFRGNHDNPDVCRAHPNYLSDCGYQAKNQMFWMAGGYSIDHPTSGMRLHPRVMGHDWWEDEELSWGALKEAIEKYADLKPKIVVSHECPTVIKPVVFWNAEKYRGGRMDDPKKIITSRTETALMSMFDAHKPDIWIFGHYHFPLDVVEAGTRFIGLGDHRRSSCNEQVFEIPGVTWE